MANERRAVFCIAQQSRDIAHENQAARFQCDSCLRRGNVRIAVVDFAVIAARCGTDHRRDAAPDALAQRFHVYIDNFTDKTKIDIFFWGPKFPATKNVGPGKSASFAAKTLDRFYNFGIDLLRQDAIDYLRCRRIGHAMTVNEFCFHAGRFERTRDGFPATVHHDRINADGFEKHDVAGDTVPFLFIRRIHEAPAILHDENLAAKALNVGKSLK